MAEGKLATIRDARRTVKHGRAAVAARATERLAEQVAFAREHSPFYAELYAGLPARVTDVRDLPVTGKKQLMGRFDEWPTDREVTRQRVEAFVASVDRVGDYFLDRYTVATTSGTTGVPGLFVIDERSMTVAAAMALRMLTTWLGLREGAAIARRRGRIAMVNATGGHFASAVAGTRLLRQRPGRARMFPVRMPLAEIVDGLNSFQPAILAPYASVGSLLASEQEAGRLKIDPVLVVLSAEGVSPEEQRRIAEAFDCIARDSYAATECPFLSYRCSEGWLHVNADWVILEAVDADHRPVPAGVASHTVLVTNLANRVQPILRYDLGDSVEVRGDSCECGSVLPAIRVQGRSGDVLTLEDERGDRRSVPPLLFATALDGVPGLDLFQIVQADRTALRLRVRVANGADATQVGDAARSAIAAVLGDQHLTGVRVDLDREPPDVTAGGKVRPVIPLR